MTITNIKQQVKNPERVSVFIDGKYSFSLSLNELLESKIKVKQELTQVELKKLQQLSHDGKLRMRTLEWLMIRPRSSRELKDYLRRKQASDELTGTLITEFQNKGYQNDKTFAVWWVQGRRSSRQRSARFIASELAAKGVDRETVNEALEHNEASDTDTLRVLIAKKRALPRFAADEQKLIEYLARQGYSFSLIKELLAE